MLLSFSVKNFGPFREQVALDMRAARAYKELPDNLLLSSSGERVLRAAAIYGANAAGKTQLVNAYHAFRSIVLQSFASTSPSEEDAIGAREPAVSRFFAPYAFSDESEDTEFEAEYAVDSGSYRYGFTYDGSSITSEWMYFVSSSTDRQSMLVERFDDLELGASVRGECDQYRYLVDDSTLALSLFARMNLKTSRFRELLGCVEGILAYGSPQHSSPIDNIRAVLRAGFDEGRRARLLEFLRSVDVGIRDVHVESRGSRVDVRTVHLGEDGREYELPLELESDGTLKAMALSFVLERASRKGGGLFIDELSSELHPLLARYIVSRFYSDGAEGQLIFSTHDVSLLDSSLMRRDQIWFVEKDDAGRASLYSLVEFRLRSGAELEKRYLSGVFGSIPRLGDFDLGEGNVA